MTDTSDNSARPSNEHTTISADWEKAKAAMSGERLIVNTNNPIDRLLAELDEDASDCKRAATSLPGRAAETIRLLVKALSGTPETGVSRVAQLETALGQWLHDFGSTNELSQRTRILLGIPHPPPVKASAGRDELNGESPRAGVSVGQPSRPVGASELPNPVDDAEFGTAEWRAVNGGVQP